ncbi:hypothetical protein RLW41_19510 [Hyphomicrobium sp. DY-1]
MDQLLLPYGTLKVLPTVIEAKHLSPRRDADVIPNSHGAANYTSRIDRAVLPDLDIDPNLAGSANRSVVADLQTTDAHIGIWRDIDSSTDLQFFPLSKKLLVRRLGGALGLRSLRSEIPWLKRKSVFLGRKSRSAEELKRNLL